MVKIVKFIYFVSLFVIGVCSMKLYRTG
ncbi:MAG: hypothetical protein PWP19_1740, partial [Thermococcaceae archaeon]|nr:hypothetical protein [Thermococcaceae archaeon]